MKTNEQIISEVLNIDPSTFPMLSVSQLERCMDAVREDCEDNIPFTDPNLYVPMPIKKTRLKAILYSSGVTSPDAVEEIEKSCETCKSKELFKLPLTVGCKCLLCNAFIHDQWQPIPQTLSDAHNTIIERSGK
jgi:hypothetical protein